jgi:flagellar hook-length control protein FliK
VVRGSPETVANLAAQILKKLDGRSTRFNVELDPAGLGRVDVRVEINAHGRISTSMAFDNPQAAADVKARSADLQQALEQAGFDMSGGMNFDIAGQQNRQGQGFSGAEDGQRGAGFRGRAFKAALDNAGEADTAAGGLNLRRGLRSAVDVRI